MPPPPPLPPRLLRSDLRRCRCIYCTQLASTCLRTAPCLFFTTLRLRGTPHIRSGSRPAKQHGGSSAACMLPVRPQPCWQSDRHRASPRPLSIHLMQVPAAAACCKTRRTRSTPHPCPFRRPPSRSRLLRGWACGGGGADGSGCKLGKSGLCSTRRAPHHPTQLAWNRCAGAIAGERNRRGRARGSEHERRCGCRHQPVWRCDLRGARL